MGARLKAFRGEILKKFVDSHQEAFPKEDKVPKNGYPDCGQGRYSEALDYKQWFLFNTAQRIHLNYLEHLPIVVIFTLVGGLHCATGAAISGVLWTIARFLYAEGYTKKGPKGRVVGAVIFDFCLIAQLYFSIRAILEIQDTNAQIIVGGIVLVAFMCLMIGFIIGGGKRRSYFTAELLEPFKQEHEDAFGKDSKLPVGEGYPDTGNGRYSS